MPNATPNDGAALPQRPSPNNNLLIRRARTIVAIVLREMGTKYGRSPGGYVWALLEPLGGLLLLSVGFSLLLRAPSLGNSFLLFYATGMLPFQMFQSVSNMVGNSLNYSRPLLQYPSVTWLDAVVARTLLYSLTGALVAVIIFLGIIEYIEFRSSISFGPILLAFGLSILMGFGIGMINSVIYGIVPVWQSIWKVLMQPLFLASAVIYIVEDLPPFAQDLLWYNPLSHITALARTGFYQSYTPNHISVTFLFVVGLSSTALGLLLMRRFHLIVLEK